MQKYTGTRLKTDISIGRLYSVHYFEYPRNYKFSGEAHDFWEFVYADKGDITVYADQKTHLLKQGSVIFHKPNEWHNVFANTEVAPNVVIVSFECKSSAMSFFENKILSVGQEQKAIISKIITEYTGAFSTPLDSPYTTKLTRKTTPVIGSEQLIKQYIAEFLISFLRQNAPVLQRSLLNINRENSLLNMVINYMLDHITQTITIDELVKYSGSNKTTIASVFKNNFDMSVMEYFFSLKTDLAKKYLREGNYNISQISEILGYSSIHYFSRQFKKETGMSPTEYSSSIQAMVKNIGKDF